MLLIYTELQSPRFTYIVRFIFTQLLKTRYEITTDTELYFAHQGYRLNYSKRRLAADEFHISPNGLLAQKNICAQQIICFKTNDSIAFFKTEAADHPFDILAASFYLISRYEEYLPYQKDFYGRYAFENSLAFKEGFLQIPLINIWAKDWAAALNRKLPGITFQKPSFRFIPTYDIDIAYKYRGKGLIRNLGGFFKSPSLERIKVLAGKLADPYDAYAYLHTLHETFGLTPVYFFLVAAKNGKYDKNILPQKQGMQLLIASHAKKFKTGLHPSWQSGDKCALISDEKKALENYTGEKVTSSRQHYIRLTLPEGYRALKDAGITDDYSMGYGSINGFRASVAASFNWYDLEKDTETGLRLHPFCYMDANSFYEQQFTATEAAAELSHYLHSCREVNGQLITIWHNNFLGTDTVFAGWRECYEQFIAQVR